MMVNGDRRWVTFSEPAIDGDGFPPFGVKRLIASGVVGFGRVGSAPAMLAPIRSIVDAAVTAWTTHG